MEDDTLKSLASELTEKLRNSTTVNWLFCESVRGRMRILIRQLLGELQSVLSSDDCTSGFAGARDLVKSDHDKTKWSHDLFDNIAILL